MIALLIFISTFAAAETTFIHGISTPIASLDPFSINSIDTYTTTANVLEPLARSNPQNGEIIPVLAKSWELNPKEKTFRVKLRDDVVFHDGRPLSAEDVQFTFEAFFNPEYQAQMWRGMWPDIESVKAIDRLTVEFKMKRWRYQSFESALTSLRILPKSFYHPADRGKFRERIVGTGPFQFARFESNRILELRRFDKWWGKDKPQHNLLIKYVPTAELAHQMMVKRELDFYALPPEGSHTFVVKGYEMRRLPSGLGRGFWLDLNWRSKLFQNPKVREALLALWKRQVLNRQIFAGQMKMALDVFSPNTDIYPKGSEQRDDLDRARKLLSDDGWRDTDKDAVLEKKNQRLEFNVLVKSADHERWVTLFQRDAALAGVKVQITRVEEDSQWLKRLQEGRFDAFAGGGGLLNEVTMPAWHSEGPYNYGKFSHKQVDRLLEQLEHEFDRKKRRLILRKLIQIVRKERPQIPGLYSEDELFMTSTRLRIDPSHPSHAWMWKQN